MTLALFILLTCMQVLDIVTTYVVLKKGGVELNPIMRKLFDKFGVIPTLLVSKVILLAVVFYGYDQANSTVSNIVLTLLCAMYTFVLANNFKAVRMTKND